MAERPHDPAELEFDAPDASATFASLAPSHRKEYARWLGDATQQGTRDARATSALERLRAGERTPR